MFTLVFRICAVSVSGREFTHEKTWEDGVPLLWESVDRFVGIVSSSKHPSSHTTHSYVHISFEQKFSFSFSIGIIHSPLWSSSTPKHDGKVLMIDNRPSSWSDIAEVVDDAGLGKPQKLAELSDYETAHHESIRYLFQSCHWRWIQKVKSAGTW